MNVKDQIFVSSTFENLKDERNEVIKACLNIGHVPVGMEVFNAAAQPDMPERRMYQAPTLASAPGSS